MNGTAELQPDMRLILLGVITLLLILVSLFLALAYAPIEMTMGAVQKIFYFHVTSAWTAFTAFFVVFVGSIGYLWKRAEAWDRLALSAAEIGTLFSLNVLFTGPMWARPVWGVWWSWEPRLTTMLILFLIFVGYLVLRSYGGRGEQIKRFAAVLGIVGFVDVPLVYLSVRWWAAGAQAHPRSIGLEPRMKVALFWSFVAFTSIFLYFLFQRLRLERVRGEVDALRESLAD